jgi:hypothetical protein
MTRTFAMLCALMLAGCGIVEKIDARTQYQKSVADYRACLDANPSDPHACDGKRLSMEVKERAYKTICLPGLREQNEFKDERCITWAATQ